PADEHQCGVFRQVALSLLGSLAPARLAPAQGAPLLESPGRAASSELSLLVVLEGRVLDPSGAPAAGTVVTSSAGGTAVTDRDGAYRLEVRVPLEAGS